MILVTGATGLNGGALVRRLSAAGVPVRALVRSPSRAEGLSTLPGVEVVEGDMARPATLTQALRGVDRAMLISSADRAMLDVQSNFVDAAAKAGVGHVVKLSGIIPDLHSPFRYARMHGEVERRLESSGMAFTHCAPASSCTRTSGRCRRSSPPGGCCCPWRTPGSRRSTSATSPRSPPPSSPARGTRGPSTPSPAPRRSAWPRSPRSSQPPSFEQFAMRHAAVFRGEQPAPQV